MTVCSRCNDTHLMSWDDGDRMVSCTSCPVPCQKCRAGGYGAFCGKTPCACECHTTNDKTRLNISEEAFQVALVVSGAKTEDEQTALLMGEIERIENKVRSLLGKDD